MLNVFQSRFRLYRRLCCVSDIIRGAPPGIPGNSSESQQAPFAMCDPGLSLAFVALAQASLWWRIDAVEPRETNAPMHARRGNEIGLWCCSCCFRCSLSLIQRIPGGYHIGDIETASAFLSSDADRRQNQAIPAYCIFHVPVLSLVQSLNTSSQRCEHTTRRLGLSAGPLMRYFAFVVKPCQNQSLLQQISQYLVSRGQLIALPFLPSSSP